MAHFYRDVLERDYDKGLNAFRESTYDLLSDLGQQIEETDRLDDLARKHEVLVKFVSELKKLRISVAQQLPNYRAWQDQTGSNDITEYHYGHLDMAHQELELMIAQGQDALETANTAISMAQVQIDKVQVQAEKEHEIAQREADRALVQAEKDHARAQRKIDKAQDRRQLRIEAGLAAVALALAIPHLLEPETTQALLGWIGIVGPHTPEGSLTDDRRLIVLVAQLGIMGAFAAVIYFLLRKGLSRLENGEQDRKATTIEPESTQNGDSKQPSSTEKGTDPDSSTDASNQQLDSGKPSKTGRLRWFHTS